jgi:hypothetical protein
MPWGFQWLPSWSGGVVGRASDAAKPDATTARGSAYELLVTVSVPFMPSASCPGTAQ